MERERIGTKATRADIIRTLVERGYVEDGNMRVTDLGLAVIETMEKYAPSILTKELTREVEKRIESVEGHPCGDSELVRETVRSIADQLVELRANEDLVGQEIDAALVTTEAVSDALGSCPVCKGGRLRITHSKKTRKRFVGCTNYTLGCKASAPLPQRGTIRTTPERCPNCSWPVVQVTSRRKPWRFCINPSCPAKLKRQNA